MRQRTTATTKLPLGWLLWITALALGIRVAWVMMVPTQPVTDFSWYFHRADEMARGMGYQVGGKPTAYWPIGYPFVLALLFKLTGASLVAGKVLSTFLCTLLVPLTGICTMNLTKSRSACLIASLLVALHPSTIAFSSILASEPLFTAICLLSLACLSSQLVTLARGLFGGVLIGLASLVRPQAALLYLIWPPLAAKKETRVIMVVLAAVGLGLALTPWTIRNFQVFHHPIFVSTNGGDNLWIGNHAGATGRYTTPISAKSEHQDLDEIGRDQLSRQEGMRDLLANPGQFLTLIPVKLERTFWDGTDVSHWAFQTQFDHEITPGMGEDKALFKLTRDANVYAVRGILIASGVSFLITGLIALFKRKVRPNWEAFGFVASSALIAIIFFGNPRFAFPCIPFFAMMIGGVIPAVGSLFEPKQASPKPSKPQASQAGEG